MDFHLYVKLTLHTDIYIRISIQILHTSLIHM